MQGIQAIHLSTSTRVEAGSISELADLTGIDGVLFRTRGCPPVFGGWSITLPEGFDALKSLQRENAKDQHRRAPRRGHRYSQVQVFDATTGERLGVCPSVNEAASRFSCPATMVGAILRGERRSYRNFRFEDHSVDNVRTFVESQHKYLVTAPDGTRTKVQSLRAASEIIGAHVNSVGLCCREGRPILGHIVVALQQNTVKQRLLRSQYSYFRQALTAMQRRRRFLMTKEEFAALLTHPEFERLFSIYEASGAEYLLKPCLDRVDPREPYTVSNVRWITLRENCEKVLHDRRILGAGVFFLTSEPDKLFDFASDAEKYFKAQGFGKLAFEQRPDIEWRPR